MLSAHVIYILRGSPGILHGHSLSHYFVVLLHKSIEGSFLLVSKKSSSVRRFQVPGTDLKLQVT